MKWAVTVLVLIGALVPSAYAVGQARDPRVPALQRQVKHLAAQQAALQDAQLATAQETAKLKTAMQFDQYNSWGSLCQAFFSTGKEVTATQWNAEPVAARLIGDRGFMTMCLSGFPPP